VNDKPRPIRQPECRAWGDGPRIGGMGFHAPRLRKLHGDDDERVDTYAVGFVQIDAEDDDWLTMKRRRK
jgi:hypothetical protein